MKSKRGAMPVGDELMTASPRQWTGLAGDQTPAATNGTTTTTTQLNSENARHLLECKRVDAPIIGDKSSFLYRLLEFGQNKKVPLSLPKTPINCEISCGDDPHLNIVTNDCDRNNSNQNFEIQPVKTSPEDVVNDNIMVNGAVKEENIPDNCYADIVLSDGQVKKGNCIKLLNKLQSTSNHIEESGNSMNINDNDDIISTEEKESTLSEEKNAKSFLEEDDKSTHVETKRSTSSSSRENPPRKVSFKVRGNTSTSRRGKMVESRVTLSSNTVAALTTKFNALINDNEGNNRSNDADCKTLLMIPPSKNQSEIKVILSRKNSNVKKEVALTSSKVTTVKKQLSNPPAVPEDIKGSSKDVKRKISITYRPSILGTKSGNVKAAIQIFEQNASVLKTKSHERHNSTQDSSATKAEKSTEPKQLSLTKIKPESLEVSGNEISDLIVHEHKKENALKISETGSQKVISETDSVITTEYVEISAPVIKPNDTESQYETSSISKPSNKHSSVISSVFKTCDLSKFQAETPKPRTKHKETNNELHGESVEADNKSGVPSVDRDVNVDNITVITVNDNAHCDLKVHENKHLSASEVVTSDFSVVNDSFSKNDLLDDKPTEDIEQTASKVAEVHVKEEALTSQDGDEETTEEGLYKVLVDNMKPNNSFLWRSTSQAPPLPPKKPQIIPVEQTRRYRAVPPPLPAAAALDRTPILEPPSAKEISLSQEDIYDDIHPPPSVYSTGEDLVGHNYSTVDDNTYDDVGYKPVDTKPSEQEPEDGYEYCSVPAYDDCEGEGYQFIGEGADREEDIYDDVKSVTTMRISDETASISNCYESIYDERGTPQRCNGSSASSSTRSGNTSSCDQSNSLYGIGGSRFDSASVSQTSTASGEYGPIAHEVWSYQLTVPGQPRSETSDEWVDVEASDSELEDPHRTIVLVQERTRSRRSPSWSRKVRNQWSKSRSADSGENSSDSDDHHYEMLEDVTSHNNKNTTATTTDNLYDDFDSFDSDDSEENTYMKPLHQDGCEPGSGRLPEPPPGQNIYGITKIAEVAGKKMLKLGRSLRRIGPKRATGSRDVHLTVSPQAPAVPTSPRPPSIPQPAPVVPPPALEKSSSASSLSGRKTWTLRKFKRSMSSSSAGQPSSTSPKTSTFYLTPPVDVDTGIIENGSSSNRQSTSDAVLENSNVPTCPSSCSSTKTLVYDSASEIASPTETSENIMPKSQPAPAPSGRRSSGNVRPNSPPPLPPLAASDTTKRSNKKEKKVSNTSWYTECGLFDQTDSQNSNSSDSMKKVATKTDKPISNSWYAAVGLWDMSPSSPNDSSLSEHDTNQQTDVSNSSTSQENSGIVQRRFLDEPLYQFYTASVVELAQRGMNSDFDSDGYEEIGDKVPKIQVRPSAMELIRPRDGQHRTLWCEIPEVVNSRVLSTLSIHQKKLQEAKFEIITSEASYMNSLNVLEHHFMSSPELNDETVLSKNDRRILFGNVIPVKTCSERFLADLERCWQDNILLHGICDTIYQHATNYFNIYIKYCSNQIYLDRTLRRLKEQHGRFAEVLVQLEASPKCQSLSLHSFLMLPMQRVTRLPLLIDAVLTRLDSKDDEYQACELALATLNKIVQGCNEGARRMERMEEILILSRQLDFPREVKPVPIISSSRWLVRSGELIQLVWRGDDAKLTFGKKFSKVTLHVFLFTDLLVITKKKSEECYTVVDHCPRNLVQVVSGEGMSHLPMKFSSDSGRNLMLLTMLQNHEKKTVEMILSCPLESDRQRWLEAMSQPTSDNPDERVYEEWDCPQVTAVHPYTAHQPDELSLDVSDVVNVLRKMSDGWYQGERIRDGERGWFPGNYTLEIASAHVRARNLKQRYRLLALSGNFLESQRKDKYVK